MVQRMQCRHVGSRPVDMRKIYREHTSDTGKSSMFHCSIQLDLNRLATEMLMDCQFKPLEDLNVLEMK